MSSSWAIFAEPPIHPDWGYILRRVEQFAHQSPMAISFLLEWTGKNRTGGITLTLDDDGIITRLWWWDRIPTRQEVINCEFPISNDTCILIGHDSWTTKWYKLEAELTKSFKDVKPPAARLRSSRSSPVFSVPMNLP